MRPHRLRVQAFGSFAEACELDLDALAGSGVFLLHGETGAGKSTLLDALCFALYGRVPRHGSKAGALRSDHAAPRIRTEVELEVTLCGRRLRLIRRPQQERPRSRGTGITTEQASVRLAELRGQTWVPLSQRLDEVGVELELLLGMTADQFQQVVLLPQGQFAAFLQADTRKRAELLQRLFATERFAAVEQWLADLRARTTQRVQLAQQDADLQAARYAQAAGCEVVPAEPDPGWAAQLLAGCRSVAAADAKTAELARQQHELARQEYEQARTLHARQVRRRTQLDLLAALEHQQPEVDALAGEFAAAVRAAEVAGVLSELDRREALAARAATEQQAGRAALEQVQPAGRTTDADQEGDLVDAPLDVLRSVADQAGRRIGLLEGLTEQAEQVAEAARQAQASVQAAERAEQAAVAAQAELAALPDRVAEAETVLTTARQAAQALPAAELAERDLRAALREVGARAEAQQGAGQVREQLLVAREHAVELAEQANDVRAARLDGMRAELAATLGSDDPCPVCGSIDHPDLYLGSVEPVTQQAEKHAQELAEQARAVVAELEATLAGLVATLARHDARLVELALGDDPSGLAEAAAEAAADLPVLRAAGATVALAEAAAAELVQAQAAAQQHAARTTTAQQAAYERAEEASTRAQRAAAALQAHLGPAASLEEAMTQARAGQSLLVGAVASTEAAQVAVGEATDARTAARTAAQNAGFADLATARNAVRTSDWREQAQTCQREHADARAAVLAALADPELDVACEPACDLTEPGARAVRAEQEWTDAQATRTRSRERAGELERILPALTEAHERLAPLEQQADQARALADLCAGTSTSNVLRMSLSSFVLAARLEQVAEVASQRLLSMTQGRYSLVHSDGAAGHGRRSGLGLLARDSWTGQDRDTASLSGGETFLAALSLALGLAEVVQQEAGGARIDALFVDEGFGTLDDQALDLAMDVLDGLRAGGRLVGVVSHVAELRARIPAQIKVHKGRRGSTVELVGAA